MRSGDAVLTVDATAGGRISSLCFGDTELLWNSDSESEPVAYGLYPMVPFAGRIRAGRFTFDGVAYSLPLNAAPHAMHGYGFSSPWTIVDEEAIAWDFAAPWPFAGRATQRFKLSNSELTIEMAVEAIDRQPIMVGWHPWFRRTNEAGILEVDFSAASMFQRDEDGLPGELVSPPPPGPWDDCFVGVANNPVARWGQLSVALSSSLDHWVVFDELDHAVCVEPQSGPPNEIESEPRILEAGETFTASFTLSRIDA